MKPTDTKSCSPEINDPIDPSKPIVYHEVLDSEFKHWAKACGYEPQRLRRASEMAVRTRHDQATIEHESHRARGRQPNIYTLSLGWVEMYYTVEPEAVVIRGYGWEIEREPLDDFDGGGLYSEFKWHQPLDK